MVWLEGSIRLHAQFARHRDRPWDMPAPRPPPHRVAILSLLARVGQGDVWPTKHGEHLFGGSPPLGLDPRREDGPKVTLYPGAQMPAFSAPSAQAAVQNHRPVVAIIAEQPPQAGGELAGRVAVIGDHRGSVPDPQAAQQLGYPFWRRGLSRHRIVGIDEVGRPVHEYRARQVTRQILIAQSRVDGLLGAILGRAGFDRSTHVHHPDLGIIQMPGKPLRLRQPLFAIAPSHGLPLPSVAFSCYRPGPSIWRAVSE